MKSLLLDRFLYAHRINLSTHYSLTVTSRLLGDMGQLQEIQSHHHLPQQTSSPIRPSRHFPIQSPSQISLTVQNSHLLLRSHHPQTPPKQYRKN